jgi:hypothetical protein
MKKHAFALTYGLIVMLTLVAPAHGEIIKLNCVDRDKAPVMSLTIDTDSQRIDQQMTGGQPVQFKASQIMDHRIRFYDTSGEFRVLRSLDRKNGELFSEIMEGPKKGMSTYWPCTKSN